MTLGLGLVGLVACRGDDPVDRSVTEPTWTGPLDANRVTLHRLNRVEYDNTVRDLLGTAQTPAISFPPDDRVGGFDNIASNLSLSPLHLELYELAAQSLATEVLAVPLSERLRERVEGEGPDTTATVGGAYGAGWILWSNGDLSTRIDAPVAGRYELSVRAWADQAGPDLAQMAIGHDGLPDTTVTVTGASEGAGEVFTVAFDLDAGPHTFTASFLNDYWDPVTYADRNVWVDWFELSGPTDVRPGANPLRDRWVTCDPARVGDEACLDEVLSGFLPKAWRRPVDAAERDALAQVGRGVLADGGTFEDALHWSFVAALVSPHFLFRVELDPDPADPASHALSGPELASRLSYFLWSTMPDDALSAAAERGDLADEEGIAAQVRRMLADPKADALVDNFGGQWLLVRGIEASQKDPNLFPEVDADLKAAMAEEMTRFLASFLRSGRDLREIVSATEGEIDARLAEHYGVAFDGPGWKTVDLASVGRGGVLGQAGLLTVAAYPARTSPVIRGKFVLGQLLCSEPPPPPPGVEGLAEDVDAQTVREQLEAHRADPVCASCHASMDELGFALEHFDAAGAWRDEDRGLPVDATGRLPDGRTFDGMRELADVLRADPELPRCMAEKLLTYAIGRLPEDSDGPYVTEITDRFTGPDLGPSGSMEALAVAVATSAPFRTRRGEP